MKTYALKYYYKTASCWVRVGELDLKITTKRHFTGYSMQLIGRSFAAKALTLSGGAK
jgi:hypothetical protein